MNLKRTVAVTAALAVAVAAPAAAAKPVNYAGKTKTGDKVTFKLAGSKITNLKAMLPTICLPTSGNPRSGTDFFEPPGGFPLGKETKVETPEPVDSAMHYNKVSKWFHVTPSGVGKKGVIKGKLHMNFSFDTLGVDTWGSYHLQPYICTGDGSFTAAPR